MHCVHPANQMASERRTVEGRSGEDRQIEGGKTESKEREVEEKKKALKWIAKAQTAEKAWLWFSPHKWHDAFEAYERAATQLKLAKDCKKQPSSPRFCIS